jgi:tetratricopeptide (TPR) repeat protein/predicted Ser/Thr protein kinase
MDGRTIGHYEVIEKLGQGGMGAVYRARDLRLDRFVALKTLPPEMTSDQGRRRRFIQEARAASALNHPNIITIYEIAEWEGADFIAMEFIEGSTLRALTETRGDLGPRLALMRQVAEAISVAHEAGIVHRDIKPDNVMVRPDGYVKVLDFGLARLSRAEGQSDTATQPGIVLGTVRYMSPEQARGDAAATASDVFSLGILFYELATGAHPFYSGPGAATAFAILSQPATPPARLNPEIQPAFESLVLRMLAKEAVLRPSAADVRAELEQLTRSAAGAPSARHTPVRRQSVGRDSERQALDASFAAAAAGAGTMVCVTGEPGLGKTTLVEEFLEGLRAERGTAWIARGRCSERLGGADALMPVLEVLDTLLRGDSGDQAARILRRFAPVWYLQVAPSLGDSTQEALVEQSKAASPERMKRELHAFVEELARLRPVVFALEDVHWADESTCDIVSYLGSRCADLPVLVVATYRPSELLSARHRFLQVKQQWQRGSASRDVPLGFLGPEDVERLVALRFPEHRFPPELLELVRAKTEGNPLFLSDMLRFLRDSQVVRQDERGWALVRAIAEFQKEIPASIRNMIQLKIDRLSEEDRRLLVTASVQGIQLDSAVVAKALGRDPADVEERLQELETLHGFVQAVGEQEFPDHTLTVRYRFVHVFYQNALYASLAPSRRVALSATVAAAIVAFSGDKLPALAADLAVLYEAARDFARAAPFFLSAARHAARLFAYPEAALLAQRGLRAVETLPDSEERARLEHPLSVTLGVSLMATKGYAAPEVEAAYRRSRDLAVRLQDDRRLFPAQWALWTVLLIGGRLREALEVAEQMQVAAEASTETATGVEALHALGVTKGYLGRLEEGCQHLKQVLARYDPARHAFFSSLYVLDPMLSSLSMLGRFEVLQGRMDEALKHVDEALAHARRLDHEQSIAYATFFQAWVRHERGEMDEVVTWADSAIALCREQGGLHQIAQWAHIARGSALCALGRVKDGVAEMRSSLEAQVFMHSALERPYSLGLLAFGLSRQGDYAEAQKRVDEALALMEKNEERICEAELHRVRGEVLLARALEDDEATAEREGDITAAPRAGDPRVAEAAAELERAQALAREAGAFIVELRAATTLFRFRQRSGDPGPAREALEAALGRIPEGAATPRLVEAHTLLHAAK